MDYFSIFTVVVVFIAQTVLLCGVVYYMREVSIDTKQTADMCQKMLSKCHIMCPKCTEEVRLGDAGDDI